MRGTDNPFYNNYIFSKKDLLRAVIKWWHYPSLILRTTYIQLTSDGYIVHFKTTADGRIFILKMEPWKDGKT